MVTDGFDVDPIGVVDESCVIIRMIVGPDTRRPIVAAPRRQRRFVESVHFGAALGLEGDMGALTHRFIVADPEIWLAVRPEPMRRPARLGLPGRNAHYQ